MAPELFSDAAALVYVMDLQSWTLSNDLSYYEEIVDALRRHAPNAKVYTLLHKTDLVGRSSPLHPSSSSTVNLESEDDSNGWRHRIIRERRIEVEKRALPTMIQVFYTSIWDESLYKVSAVG